MVSHYGWPERVGKFVNLWQNGREASLQVNSKAGKAIINLQVELGEALPLQPHQQQPERQPGPSRVRRRLRRAEDRRLAEEESTKVETEEVAAGNVENREDDAAAEATTGTQSDVGTEKVHEVNVVSSNDVTENIPQLDGESEQDVNEPTYCKLCKECPDEIESAEDLSYHMMNDHEAQEVLDNYGQQWIEDRRYCIRRWSPFTDWFSTPLI